MCYWILWHCACGKKYGVVEVAMEWRARVAEIRVEVEGRPSAPNFNPFIPRRTVQHRFTSSRRLTGVENGNVAEEAVEWCGRVAKIWVEVDGRPAVPNSKLIILRQSDVLAAVRVLGLPGAFAYNEPEARMAWEQAEAERAARDAEIGRLFQFLHERGLEREEVENTGMAV
ncbi:hypothetical protein EJ06DRAFT_521660 [Trichodelitschia bisporula]|uniref:Uncharacterized protein n=1 Tax=Trichodelitschia bisporula TaxID=703511 RepID=A0A6G1HZ57_9PEZI|nr:hypothetical protein EJ06DRAFT_521660 [Trichodelitschia bisporula]